MRSRAPSAISASRSMTRLPFPDGSKSNCEHGAPLSLTGPQQVCERTVETAAEKRRNLTPRASALRQPQSVTEQSQQAEFNQNNDDPARNGACADQYEA
jgi:hypothetical protein